jgi:A/G-specific adenine glycosylase
MADSFAGQLLAWYDQHGRHDLPWHHDRNAYRVWVSEIMLQQTQVSAVVGYYQQFMRRFPDVVALAAAEQEEVLQYWSGLGYYSRARNLHAAARIIVQVHEGRFPQGIEQVMALPGIGKSTAAAITAFAFGQRQAILDGNVKRVLARCFGIAGWPGTPEIENRMWKLSVDLLPQRDIEAYTQGLMDLGAMVCRRARPACGQCPLHQNCVARLEDRVHLLPTPKPRKAIPQRETVMLLVMLGNQVLLEKRPSPGIWGGLWSLPEVSALEEVQQSAKLRFGLETRILPTLSPLMHAFTHFALTITPQPLQVVRQLSHAMEPGLIWLDIEEAVDAALPAPVRKLLQRLPVKMSEAA